MPVCSNISRFCLINVAKYAVTRLYVRRRFLLHNDVSIHVYLFRQLDGRRNNDEQVHRLENNHNGNAHCKGAAVQRVAHNILVAKRLVKYRQRGDVENLCRGEKKVRRTILRARSSSPSHCVR